MTNQTDRVETLRLIQRRLSEVQETADRHRRWHC